MRQTWRMGSGLAIGAALSLGLLALAAIGQKTPIPPSKPASTLFEAKVRPLFLASCAACHSKESAQGALRLDAPLPLEKAKEVVRRVKGEGGKPRMPLGGQLSAEKIAALEQWVGEGAPWPQGVSIAAPTLMEKGKSHWAFQPLKRPAVPGVKNTAWVRNPIDAFILSRLEAKGLSPAPTATRRELIRRVTYDLIGLPPTPEEVAAFEADRSPNAYEKLVDRLLASPHYGEKWGRRWLDLVRYAETNSYERDNPKPNVTKYRDYVIRAFNADKPYSRFVKEQLAGDEMPDAAGEGLAATGYYRLGIWDDEPADVKQAEFDDLDDLVVTTGQTFLGLTLDCARCHDHKLDPIPQKDYYRFLSFFRNINRFKNGGPTDEAAYFSTPEQKRDYERRAAELEHQKQSHQTQIAAIEAGYKAQRPKLLNPADLSGVHYRYFEGSWAQIPDFDALKPAAQGSLDPGFLDLRPRKRNDNFGFVFEGALNVARTGDYTFFLDSDDGARLTVAGKKLLDKNASGGQGNEQRGVIHLEAGSVPFRVDYFQGGAEFGISLAWGGPGFTRRPLSTLESCSALGLPGLMAAELPLLLGPEKAAQYAGRIQEKGELAKRELSVEKVLCVTEAGSHAPDTFVLKRGNVADPGDKVEPAFPVCMGGQAAVIPAPAANAPTTGRRTALADWIVSPDNGLAARVIANRIWQGHFGRGIVRTPNDFGLQGAPPTHPELLDWLASVFVSETPAASAQRDPFACGGSFKKLHRLILTSNAYKQASRPTTLDLAKDPQNDLCSHFDMRRLDAEEIRDSLLAVSGNLNLAMYGDCVYPEIPKEILAGQSKPGADWYTEKMKPEDLNRRSLYIHVKRSLIYPLLAEFDLPETDRTTPARFASTQPTQALSMINGPLTNQQAKVLAARVRKEAGADGSAFTRRLLTLVLQRPPMEAEVAEGVGLLERLTQRGAKPEQAEVYLCLTALSMNEFVYLD